MAKETIRFRSFLRVEPGGQRARVAVGCRRCRALPLPAVQWLSAFARGVPRRPPLLRRHPTPAPSHCGKVGPGHGARVIGGRWGLWLACRSKDPKDRAKDRKIEKFLFINTTYSVPYSKDPAAMPPRRAKSSIQFGSFSHAACVVVVIATCFKRLFSTF